MKCSSRMDYTYDVPCQQTAIYMTVEPIHAYQIWCAHHLEPDATGETFISPLVELDGYGYWYQCGTIFRAAITEPGSRNGGMDIERAQPVTDREIIDLVALELELIMAGRRP